MDQATHNDLFCALTNSFKPRPLRGSAAWWRGPLRRSAQRSGL